jgi:BlaI family penicillinase repressor
VASISNAEWVLMKVLWPGAPMTAQQVIDALPADVEWKAKTVKTLLGRLVAKGVLGFERAGREHVYTPTVEEAACKLEEAETFLDRVFDGALAPLVAHLADHGALSKKDIAELRRVLDQAEQSPRRRRR